VRVIAAGQVIGTVQVAIFKTGTPELRATEDPRDTQPGIAMR
jgi:hypothetical protein